MRVFIVTLALLTAACSATVDGTEMGGVAQWYGATPAPAIQAAQTHCQKYGKAARPSQVESWGGYVTFSCEKA